MQPALFNVRSNLAQLPRSISPHLSSSSSSSTPSSIRSLSPSRRSSPHLRSRSASPSPRRFASVLAYHAIPPPGGYDKQRSISADQQQSQQQSQQENESSSSEQGSREHSRTMEKERASRDRQESPSRIAVRNLEESWKRFEPDSGPSSPSLVSSATTFGSSPLSPRPASSPSPLSRPPYRELIECTFFKDTKVLAPVAENKSGPSGTISPVIAAGERGGGNSAVLNSESNNNSNNSHDDDHRNDHGRRRTTNIAATTITTAKTITTTTPSSTKKSTGPLSSSPAPASSTLLSSAASPTPISSSASKGATATPSEDSVGAGHQQQQQQQQQQWQQQRQVQSAFLASNEARHILDLPSLLGQEPDMISQVLAMPIPVQPKTRLARPSSLSSTGDDSSLIHSTEDDDDNSAGSTLISKLNAKAESTAEAMTKRYAAKNLNMTETEAHRMVQVMAAEIVALHEERAVMVQKMEQAKQDMLEAAWLLRMKAAASEEPGELQDMSAEGRRRRSLAGASSSSGGDGVKLSVHEDSAGQGANAEKEDESAEDRQRRMYDRDEWRDRDRE